MNNKKVTMRFFKSMLLAVLLFLPCSYAQKILLGPNSAQVTGVLGVPNGGVGPSLGTLGSCNGTNQTLQWNGSSFNCIIINGGTGTIGTVTSVGVAVPAFMTSTSPVTTTGNITIGFTTQSGNYILASPSGSTGVPTFRQLTSTDISLIGILANSISGNAATATALANTPTVCPTGQVAQGINASGNSVGCTTASSGANPAGTINGQLQLRNIDGTAFAAIIGAGFDASNNLLSPQSLFLGGMTSTTNAESVGNYTPPGGIASRCIASSATNSNVISGSGRTSCNQFALINNGWGRNVGNNYSATQGSWQVSSTNYSWTKCFTPGICEHGTNLFAKTSPGDWSVSRNFISVRPGGRVGSSDENGKMFYMYQQLLNDYTGTVNAGYAGTGLTAIVTTQNSGQCGGVNGAPFYCYGAQLPIINTTVGPIVTGTVSAMVVPSAASYGTFTVSNTLTPVPYGTITTSIPDTTNFSTGSTFTATVNITSGTPASSGLACIASSNASLPETLSYTLSGTTATFSGHRYPQGSDNIVTHPTFVFFNACKAFIDLPDAAIEGRKAVFWILGAINSNTFAWVSYDGGARATNNINGPNTSFRAGVTGQNTYSVYETALVVSAFDPATGPGTVTDGYMTLANNNVTFNVGDTIEQLYEPSGNMTMMDLYMNGDTFSGGSNAGISMAIGNSFTVAQDYVLNNNIAQTTAGGGYRNPLSSIFRVRSVNYAVQGAYNMLYDLRIAPQGFLFSIGCQAGDTTGSCSNSTAYTLFNLAGNNGGGKITWNAQYGAMDFTLSNRLAFSTFSTQIAYIGGTGGGNQSVTFVKSNDALNNWRGTCSTCTQTSQRVNIQMVDQNGASTNTDLVVGPPTYALNSNIPIVASSQGFWAGTFHATNLTESAVINGAYHQSALIPAVAFTGTAGSTNYRYYYVPVFPNQMYGRSANTDISINNIPTTLNGSNYITVTCPTAIEPGFPTGTTYMIITRTGSVVRNLGTCPINGTVTDTGGGTVVPSPTTVPYTLNATGDTISGRFIANPLGIIGFYNNYDSTINSIDSAITRIGVNSLAIGNGTQGNTTGSLTLGTLTATSGTINGKNICLADGTNCIAPTSSQITTALGYTPLNPSNNLSDVSNVGTARTNLGLGSIATQSAGAVALTGGTATNLTSIGTASLSAASVSGINTLTMAASGTITGTSTSMTMQQITTTNLTATGTTSINGGSINNTSIGNVTPSVGYFTNVTISGTTTLGGDPTLPMQAATKQYIDNQLVVGYSNIPITSNTIITGSSLMDNYQEVNCTCSITIPAYTTMSQRFAFVNIGTGTVTIIATAIGNSTSPGTSDTIAPGTTGRYIANGVSAWRRL